MDRFYLPDLAGVRPGAELRLGGAEAHHLARVKRLRPGDRVRLFDGRGAEVEAEVGPLLPGGDGVALRVVGARVEPEAALAIDVVLGVAPPQGDRLDLVIEKGTELGMAGFFPLVARRGVVRLKGSGREAAKVEKWRRRSIEAAKQCGVARLPELLPPMTVAEAVAWAAGRPADLRLIPHLAPGARPLREVLAERAAAAAPPPAGALVLIGPEGGFADDEVATAVAGGFAVVRLAPTVLRVETAAIAALAALAVAYG